MDQPETCYTITPDGVRIAYQVFGAGQHDLVIGGGPQFAPIDLIWEEPSSRRMLERLASFARVMVPDGRGMGAFDDITPTGEGLFEDRVP